MIPLEILDNLCKFFMFFGLLLDMIKKGSKGVERVENCFMYIKMKLTGLSTYELKSIEGQRKVFGLLFENLPFALLMVCIEFKILNCTELLEG